MRLSQRPPDGYWAGNAPTLLVVRRGEGVDALIVRLQEAVRAYPFADTYTLWPGPNSNTFTATVLRAVPELETSLPPNAVGKDFRAYPYLYPCAATERAPGFNVATERLSGL